MLDAIWRSDLVGKSQSLSETAWCLLFWLLELSRSLHSGQKLSNFKASAGCSHWSGPSFHRKSGPDNHLQFSTSCLAVRPRMLHLLGCQLCSHTAKTLGWYILLSVELYWRRRYEISLLRSLHTRVQSCCRSKSIP